MAETDTVKLLRECDAGIKMGVTAIDDVLGCVGDDRLKAMLADSKEQHETLKKEIHYMLAEHGEDGKSPNPMAKGMSWIKTNVKLTLDESDKTVADLVTDGCNMGVKSLRRYLNQYVAADERSKDITKRLISVEEELGYGMGNYL